MVLGSRPHGNRGFTYVALLAAIAVLGVGLGAVATRWSDQLQRDREQQLWRIGQLYAGAIASYYQHSPGSVKTYPRDVHDLLLDPRMLRPLHHLRSLYTDPLQPGQPWGIVRAPDGTIRGVHSTSLAVPFHEQGVDLGITQLAPARRYADWLFVPKVQP